MDTKARKHLRILSLVLLCSLLLGSFLIGSSILAQEEIEKYGEIAGGKSDSIPIQLKVGEMVQGEIIAVRNQRLRLSIADYTGKSIHDFGETSTRGGFYYAAETDGQHYIVVTNPDSFSVGTRGYTLKYMIKPTDLAPGSGSGKPIGEKGILPWIIAGISIAGLILLIIFIRVFIRRKKEKRKLKYYHYELYGRWERYSIEQLEGEILRIESKRRELHQRLNAFGRAAPRVIIGKRQPSGLDDIESQMMDIKLQLEKLDLEEEGIRQVLREKKAKHQRA